MLTRCCAPVVRAVTATARRRPDGRAGEYFSAIDLEIDRKIRYDVLLLPSDEGGAHGEYHVDDPNDRVRRPARYVHLTLPITSASSR
jgi:hypothetical protein